ncbi:putative acetyltransferase [Gammaproteobacteria bacterium MOLA455]|nr:putative acetyltransferase [Gammaproteobacteria bacterium MOLA455]
MQLPSNCPEFKIRPARVSDCSTILHFIHLLAEYEKLAHEVVADEEKLAATLFGDSPSAEVIIAEYQSKPVGLALFFTNYSTFLAQPGIYLEDLFVEANMRGKGFGKALLTHLAKIAVSRHCGRLEWSVLDWNQPAIDFYQSLGALPMEGWTVNRLTGEALQSVAKQAN